MIVFWFHLLLRLYHILQGLGLQCLVRTATDNVIQCKKETKMNKGFSPSITKHRNVNNSTTTGKGKSYWYSVFSIYGLKQCHSEVMTWSCGISQHFANLENLILLIYSLQLGIVDFYITPLFVKHIRQRG